ncbi:murein L,D-transpeptidase catalytic domain family protein [Chitinophaga horti]|uniref:Murein L,D-transpeptidase catalytic domain family protein n=1 Tax=Chitinophaga horti TaxID=2920382 RepID=A0ABY6IVY7_9BACT|nr:murein L,D-transpeptidase catalytic domain family protein [Chitinophaga horti]UYQ91366.1 murein L,D-transpeptidase catalytic domain family protein [Chitinophaga horti]
MKLNLRKVKPAIFAITLVTLVVATHLPSNGNKTEATKAAVTKEVTVTRTSAKAALYDQLALDSIGLSKEAFDYALAGYEQLVKTGKVKNDDVISIVDFSLPSSKKRLFVIDLENGKLLFNTLVSHGRNSGKGEATSFSNAHNSFKSSLGFYITGATYSGEHGYSLRLNGEEKGINDNALSRGIVMHCADYVNEGLVRSQGYIGRSLGCPAIPTAVHKKVIQTIRDGSCLFLYSPDKGYIARSKMINFTKLV